MSKLSLSSLNNKHFLSLAGNGILAVFGLLQMSLLYYSMSMAQVGEWFYFLNIISLCDAVRNGFLSTATIKFYAGTTGERAREVMGSVWFLAISLTLVVIVLNVGALFLLNYTNELPVVVTIKWLGLTFLSSLPFTVVFWILQADEDYGKILILRFINNGSTILAFVLLVLLHKMTLERAIMFNFITNCVTSMVAIFWRWNTITALAQRSKNMMSELYHFGKFSLATSLSSSLFRSSDIFIIRTLLGPEAVAIYNIPSRLMEIVEIPLRSFVGTGISSMAVAFNNKNMDHIKYILKKYAGMLTIAFVPATLLVLLFADVAVNLFASKKYIHSEAANVLRLLMVVALMYPLDRFNGITLDIIHKPKVNFQKVIIMLSVNIIGDFIGMSLFHNIYGVVFAVFFATLSGLIFGYINLRKYIDYTISGTLLTGLNEIRQLYTPLLARLKR